MTPYLTEDYSVVMTSWDRFKNLCHQRCCEHTDCRAVEITKKFDRCFLVGSISLINHGIFTPLDLEDEIIIVEMVPNVTQSSQIRMIRLLFKWKNFSSKESSR